MFLSKDNIGGLMVLSDSSSISLGGLWNGSRSLSGGLQSFWSPDAQNYFALILILCQRPHFWSLDPESLTTTIQSSNKKEKPNSWRFKKGLVQIGANWRNALAWGEQLDELQRLSFQILCRPRSRTRFKVKRSPSICCCLVTELKIWTRDFSICSPVCSHLSHYRSPTLVSQ